MIKLNILATLIVYLGAFHLSNIIAISTSINDFLDNMVVLSQAKTENSSAIGTIKV